MLKFKQVECHNAKYKMWQRQYARGAIQHTVSTLQRRRQRYCSFPNILRGRIEELVSPTEECPAHQHLGDDPLQAMRDMFEQTCFTGKRGCCVNFGTIISSITAAAVLTGASWVVRDGSVRGLQCFSPEILTFSLLPAGTHRNSGARTRAEIDMVAADARKLAPARDASPKAKDRSTFGWTWSIVYHRLALRPRISSVYHDGRMTACHILGGVEWYAL